MQAKSSELLGRVLQDEVYSAKVRGRRLGRVVLMEFIDEVRGVIQIGGRLPGVVRQWISLPFDEIEHTLSRYF